MLSEPGYMGWKMPSAQQLPILRKLRIPRSVPFAFQRSELRQLVESRSPYKSIPCHALGSSS
ncbi:MAG: hypothetical protein CL912_09425 [Deltaproteobacteria bacterium]|nr:hypothetical protein [Deltaproteobacteria bacterium]